MCMACADISERGRCAPEVMRRRGPGSGDSLLSWNSCIASTSPSCALKVACAFMVAAARVKLAL